MDVRKPWSYGKDNRGWYLEQHQGTKWYVLVEEDARRFAACLNACRGFLTETLEDGLMCAAEDVLRRQRDEINRLREAMKEALESGEDGDWQSSRQALMTALVRNARANGQPPEATEQMNHAERLSR